MSECRGTMDLGHHGTGEIMAPATIRVTRDELLARRSSILSRLGLSIDELRNRSKYKTLSGEEWEAVSELEEIGFLLDDTTEDF